MTRTDSTGTPVGSRLLRPLSAARHLGPDAVASAVHGLVLFVAIVGATFVGQYPAWRMLLFASGAVVLFWVAHVYAATLGDQQTAAGSAGTAVVAAVREARRALPMLEACIPPAVPLVLSMIGMLPLPVAYAASVTIGVVTLAVVGFLALRNRRASLRRSLVAAAGSGCLGAAIIAAETFWH